MLKFNLEFDEVTRFLLRFRMFKNFAEKHSKRAGSEIIKNQVKAWKSAAPHLSGSYARSITGQIQSMAGVEVTTIVKSGATNDGYDYPRLLEYHPRTNYRAGTRAGSRTYNQAYQAIEGTLEGNQKIIHRMAMGLINDILKPM